MALRAGANRLIGRPWLAITSAILLTVLALLVVLVSVGLAPSSRGDLERPLAWGPAGIAVTTALVVAGWMLVDGHPGSTVGLSLVGMAWLVPGLAAWPLVPAQGRAAALAAAPLAAAGVAVTVHGWLPVPMARRASLVAAAGLAAAAVLVHVLGYDPFLDPACAWTCEQSPAVLSAVLGPHIALDISAALTLAASSAAAAASIRNDAASRGTRAAGAVAAMLVGLARVLAWRRVEPAGTSWNADLLQGLGTTAIVSATLVALVHTRRVRRDVHDLVAQLAGSRPVSSAAAVAAIHFTVPHDGRWVDAAGLPVSARHPEHCAVLRDAQGEAVRLVLRQGGKESQVLSSITPAGRLALENARLQAAGLARLAELQASQRRIVEATDLERRRIERDLHDGAQQRLVAVALQLSSARRRSGAASEALLEGATRVRDALDALRDLSHDSLAEVLYAEGLSAALEELVARLPLRVDLDTTRSDRHLPSAVQTAVYVTVAAALDNVVLHACTDHAQVTVRTQGDALVVRIADGGQGGAVMGRGLTDVADRVGALGGSLEVTSRPAGGTEVVARLSCES